ncbi:hypothetical protein CERZMDRAFT_91116 [Cercospora zeae-maydis SCOH1-5]|uniref:Uncharacterized protein n=1 Tax=Cercospora zeae-maydis SCOH1-5 TaxID=717836 RepID=A0A6A6FB29_9PEZI|nr:hypothetical protein CERZMDRAFT_91116 [Cercospora zeae-maydis SCOH1-5]
MPWCECPPRARPQRLTKIDLFTRDTPNQAFDAGGFHHFSEKAAITQHDTLSMYLVCFSRVTTGDACRLEISAPLQFATASVERKKDLGNRKLLGI